MKKSIFGLSLSISLLAFSFGAQALSVTVDAKQQPWEFSNTLNSDKPFGADGTVNPAFTSPGGQGPEIAGFQTADIMGPFAGSEFTFNNVATTGINIHPTFPGLQNLGVEGTTLGGRYGDDVGYYGLFPSFYSSDSANLGRLIGVFTDDNGAIKGDPFALGAGSFSVLAPLEATRLQFGINDDLFPDNSGTFTFDVTQSAIAAVPVPPAVWLFGSALLGLTAMRKRKS